MEPERKHTVRALLLDEDGRVLLQEFRDPTTGREVWLTPGGGLLPDEGQVQALRRELAEETGRTELEVGRRVLRRDTRFLWAGQYHAQVQTFFLVRTTRFSPRMADRHEASNFVEARWWDANELRASGVHFDPPELLDLVVAALQSPVGGGEHAVHSPGTDGDAPSTRKSAALHGVDENVQFIPVTPRAGGTASPLPLRSEGVVSPDRNWLRAEIAHQLRQAPDSFFAYWQTLALDTGCRHACALCAQETGTAITSFTRQGLEDVLSAMLTVATERHRSSTDNRSHHDRIVGYGFDTYRSGIIKLSHDSDSGDSPLLADAVRHIYENFGMKSRLSMVAYSRHDRHLQEMHETVVRELADAVDSVRFSFSSHPLGWRRDRDDYLLDFSNMLRTWRPFVDGRRGSGRYHGAITEFRIDPDVETADGNLDDEFLLGHHVIRFGPTLLVSWYASNTRPPMSVVTGVDGRSATFSEKPVGYAVFTSDALVRGNDWRAFAQAMIALGDWPSVGAGHVGRWHEKPFHARSGSLFQLSNCDGAFYAFEPFFRPDGQYEAINIYPRTATRERSGVYLETRWDLNALFRCKEKRGVGRREAFPDATWADVEGFLREIQDSADRVSAFDERAATYVRTKVEPVVSGYVEALRNAGYEPEFVFDPNFTYFAGPLYNLGRAVTLFKGLVSRREEPVTAAEMREYYLTYQFQPPTKLSPIPLLQEGESLVPRLTGTKYRRGATGAGAVVFEQLNRIGMQPSNSVYIRGLVGLVRRRSGDHLGVLGLAGPGGETELGRSVQIQTTATP